MTFYDDPLDAPIGLPELAAEPHPLYTEVVARMDALHRAEAADVREWPAAALDHMLHDVQTGDVTTPAEFAAIRDGFAAHVQACMETPR